MRPAPALAVTAGLLVGGWLLLAPPQLGGRTSYVVTYGVSMLPALRAGELVLLRREPSYHVGEVAGYRDARLRAVVLHRIVAIDGRRYVFKGDHNDFVDPYRPTKAEIVGAEWAQLSGVGRALEELRAPGVAAAGLGALWILSFRRRFVATRRRRRHRHAH